MKKIYLLLLFIGCSTLSTFGMQAQSDTHKEKLDEIVEVYPNPAKSDILYITSRSGKTKMISAYNVLGERVMFEVLTTKELDISSLPLGVYILRIKIGKETFSKKLIRN